MSFKATKEILKYCEGVQGLNASEGNTIEDRFYSEIVSRIEQDTGLINKMYSYVSKSQNFQHTNGTTQTNTNNLDAKVGKTERTTRMMHQKQVAECAGQLVDKMGAFGNYPQEIAVALQKRHASLARLIGLSHDIGHCLYGHDGEEALGNALKAQDTGATYSEENGEFKSSGMSGEIADRRKKYFGKAAVEGERSYEDQQKEQNGRVGDRSTEKNYIFDHGEESAWAFIEICEAKGLSIENSTVNEAIQGILFHSRPDFETSSPAIQAVQISDSMAFIQDDFTQFTTFGKITPEAAKGKVEQAVEGDKNNIRDQIRYQLFGTFDEESLTPEQKNQLNAAVEKDLADMKAHMNMSSDDRLEKAQEEVVTASNGTGKLQNGQHLVDEMWILGKLAYRKPLPTREEVIDIFKSFGIDAAEVGGITVGENGRADKTSIENAVKKAKIIITAKFRKQFPVNYRNHQMKETMSNPLIFGEMIGNNMNQDKAKAEFLVSKMMLDYAKKVKHTSENQKMNSKTSLYEFLSNVRDTDSFKKIKEIMQKSQQNQYRGMNALNSVDNKQQMSDVEVLRCLGFNIPEAIKDLEGLKSLNENAALNQYTPNQLIVKMVAGQTNEFSRDVAKEMAANLSKEEIQALHTESFGDDESSRGTSAAGDVSLEQGALDENSQSIAKIQAMKFNAKGFLYVGIPVDRLMEAGIKVSEIDLAARDVRAEKKRQYAYLAHEGIEDASDKELEELGIIGDGPSLFEVHREPEATGSGKETTPALREERPVLGEGIDRVENLEYWVDRARDAKKLIEETFKHCSGRKPWDKLKYDETLLQKPLGEPDLTTLDGIRMAYAKVCKALKVLENGLQQAKVQAGSLEAVIGELSGGDKAIVEEYRQAEAAAIAQMREEQKKYQAMHTATNESQLDQSENGQNGPQNGIE